MKRVNEIHKEIDKIEKKAAEEGEEEEKKELSKEDQEYLADYHSFLGIFELLSEACLGQNFEC